MTLDLWHIIGTTTMEVRVLLDSALPRMFRDPDSTQIMQLGSAVQSRLREELLNKLSELKTGLRSQLSEKEVGMVLLPLVIHIDELVMRRLSHEAQTKWVLLQRELFDLQNGGEVFYQFIEERINTPDTPPLLFEVLYFCLSDGFSGKYDDEPARIEKYKLMLVDKIPLPALPPPGPKKRRGRDDPDPNVVVPPIRAIWFYLSALAAVVVLAALTALLTNL